MAIKPGMVTIDCADPRALATFWTEAAGYRVAVDYGVFMILDGDGLRLGLQQVPEPRVRENQIPGLRWTVLTGPEGVAG